MRLGLFRLRGFRGLLRRWLRRRALCIGSRAGASCAWVQEVNEQFAIGGLGDGLIESAAQGGGEVWIEAGVSEDGSAGDDLAAGVELALIEFLFGFQLEAATTLLLLGFFEGGDLFGAGASGHGGSSGEKRPWACR